MADLAWLIPALPLAGFVLILLFGRRLGEPRAGWLATIMCGGAFVVAVGVFFDLLSKTAEERRAARTIFDWVPSGTLKVGLSIVADPLSITMALFVTGIGTLIHLYAIGYMHGDPKFSKFFLYLNLFAFSMLMLVLGGNMLVTFLGWEGVGACSYFLISFWHTRTEAPPAGKKAFVTNRVGDFGFMIAMFLTYQAVGSLDYSRLNDHAGTIAHSTAVAIALFIFLGAVGKSAQFPLYLWLPDAMAGPTPVSALIHAATMVTSGVYLTTRIAPILHVAPSAGKVIAIVGAFTALFAATIAVAQNDIKRVLAYSTVSQLGYMFLAVGSGAYVAAVFHMVTHAFFKALLFLGSGSVIHGMHEEQDMRRMGMLRKFMPITAGTFIVGWLAIAGIPPFAGFWSKDEILLSALHAFGGLGKVLWAVGFLTAMLTAYYMTRQVVMVFFGDNNWNRQLDATASAGDGHGHGAADAGGHEGHHEDAPDAAGGEGTAPAGARGLFGSAEAHVHPAPHESPWLMLTPLVVLAGLSLVGGAINLPGTGIGRKLESWLEPVVGGAERQVSASAGQQWFFALLTTLACVVAIGGAVLVYQRKRVKALEPEILAHGWHYDETVSAFMGGPGRAGFQAMADGDAVVVDAAVNGTGSLIAGLGGVFRRLQSGFVRNYAVGIGLGAVALLAWFVTRGVF